MKRFIFLVVLFMITSVFAHSTEEKTSVACYLIDLLRNAPETRDSFGNDPESEVEVSFPTYTSLFEVSIPSNAVGFGWSQQEKVEAFEEFIRDIPRLSRAGGFKGLRSYGETALRFCSEQKVTNSFELSKSVLQSPPNPCVDAAISLFRESVRPSCEATAFVEACVTNADMRALDADYLALEYASALRERRTMVENSVLTNSVSMLLRLPVGCHSRRVLDLLLIDAFPSYEGSSNRLDLACRTLNSLEASQLAGVKRIIAYFTAVTNRLLNAAQPLPEVEALRGL